MKFGIGSRALGDLLAEHPICQCQLCGSFDDALFELLVGLTQCLFGSSQGVFGLFALGDVQEGDDGAHTARMNRTRHRHGGKNRPDHRAVAPLHSDRQGCLRQPRREATGGGIVFDGAR